MNRLGVGIVGANWAARGHLPAWRMLPDDVSVNAICTTKPETARAAAAKFEIGTAYHDFAAMLADPAIDIVSLGAPPPARFDMTIAALAAGKHVFSCVPFAVTLEQANAMAVLRAQTGRASAVDAYFQFTPAYRFLKDLIEDQVLGELYGVNIDFSMSQFVRMTADYPYRWTGYAANGTGVVPNSCSHVFHTLIHLFGPLAEIVGQTVISRKIWEFENGTVQVPEVADTAVLLARLQGGALVNIHAGRAVPSGTGFRLSAYGEKARLVAHSPAYPLDRNTVLTLGRPAQLMSRDESELEIPARYFEWPGGLPADAAQTDAALSLGALFANLVTAIRAGGDARPSFARAAHVQGIVEAVARSELSRSWEKIMPEEAYQE